MENKTIELSENIKAVVKWELDEYGDLSWLGEFVREQDDYTIDRQLGILVGKYGAEKTVTIPAADLPDLLDSDGDPIWSMVWAHFEKEDVLEKLAPEILCDSPDVDFDEAKQAFVIDLLGYEVLKRGLGNVYQRHQYRYFRTSDNHLPHKPESWHVSMSNATRAEIIQKHGSLLQADIAYALEDWKRMERYGEDWNFVYCRVAIELNGVEVASDSLGGIESDSGDDHFAEVERDCIQTALASAKAQADALTAAILRLHEIEYKPE